MVPGSSGTGDGFVAWISEPQMPAHATLSTISPGSAVGRCRFSIASLSPIALNTAARMPDPSPFHRP
jgi:hypothetical protein